MFNQITTSTNPEIQTLLNQSRDLKNYMNELEIQGDLWTQEDLTFFLYLEDLLIDIGEEIHYLRVNEIF